MNPFLMLDNPSRGLCLWGGALSLHLDFEKLLAIMAILDY